MELFDILVQAAISSTPTSNTPPVNSFYFAWGCFSVLASLFIGSIVFLSNLIPLAKNSKEKFETARLTLKENIANVFMETITSEAQLLIGVIAEHLPTSITQAHSTNPHTSSFDKFCIKIIELSKKNPDDPRKGISEIMAKEFSGHIAKEAGKLSKILKIHPRLGHTDYNATGISYALEKDTASKFRFIAKYLFEAEREENNYVSCQKSYRCCFVFTIISFASFLVPLLLNERFCHFWGIISVSTLVVSFVSGFLLWWHSYTIIEKINRLTQRDFQLAYEEWKKYI